MGDILELQLATTAPLLDAVRGGGLLRPDVSRLGCRRDEYLAHSLLFDRDGELLFCGQTLAQVLGATPMALVGRRVQDLLPGLTPERLLLKCGFAHDEPPHVRAGAPNHAAQVLEATRRAWGIARPVAPARRIAREDGTTLPIDLTYGALSVRGGRVLVLGVYPRSTAGQARLLQLAGEVERYPALGLITNAGGRIEYVNQPLEARFGYAAFELIGRPVATLQALEAADSAAFFTGRPWLGEVAFRDRRGERFKEEIRIRPWAVGGGPITHCACFGRDAVEHTRGPDRRDSGSNRA